MYVKIGNKSFISALFFLPLWLKSLNMEQTSQVIFDKNSIEFVTVAAEYCGFIERARDAERKTFVDTALKILPLLYLKADRKSVV